MTQTVIEYLLSRVQKLGIGDVSGIAGGFAFPIDDAVVTNGQMGWTGGCDELNAAYSADGYARIHCKEQDNCQQTAGPRAPGF